MFLPNAENAIINAEKTTGYVLSFEHFEGKHKAKKFESVLGLIKDDSEYLIKEIKTAILFTEAIKQPESLFGEKYIVDFSLTFKNNMATIRTAWIIEFVDKIPRLVTCYIK